MARDVHVGRDARRLWPAVRARGRERRRGADPEFLASPNPVLGGLDERPRGGGRRDRAACRGMAAGRSSPRIRAAVSGWADLAALEAYDGVNGGLGRMCDV